jgi:hypothetical protein
MFSGLASDQLFDITLSLAFNGYSRIRQDHQWLDRRGNAPKKEERKFSPARG